ncbi:MAG: ABC transporter permease, partial [Pirellulaceae bacterium]|nr:ABC transporter permease [Pirellulaceae bacterium]
MTWLELLRNAIDALLQHKLRTLLTLLGVMLGSLLLFTSLAGGLGVIQAVNHRLSAGNRLLQINVHSGIKEVAVTPETARRAGFTQEMTDQRRVRLAREAGVGGKEHVSMTVAAVDQLRQVPHVAASWPELRFSASVHFDASDRWVAASVEGLPPAASDVSQVIVAGTMETPDKNSVLVSELLLYQAGIQTEQQVQGALGTTLRVATRHPPLERLSLAMQGPDAPKSLPPDARQQLSAAIDNIAYRSRPLRITGVYRKPTDKELQLNPNLLVAAHRQVLLSHPASLDCWTGLGKRDQGVTAVVIADVPENVRQVESAINQMGFRTQSLSGLAV